MIDAQKSAVERITEALASVPEKHQDAVADTLVNNIGVMAMTIRAMETRK